MTLSDILVSFRVCFPSYFLPCNVHLVSSSVNQLLWFTFLELIMLTHSCNPSIWKTESGGLMSSRPTWPTYHPKIHKIQQNKQNQQARKKMPPFLLNSHSRQTFNLNFLITGTTFCLEYTVFIFSLFCK